MPHSGSPGGRPAPASRTAFVSGPGWPAGWTASAPATARSRIEDHDDGVRLLAADGASALLQAPWPDDGRPGAAPIWWPGWRRWRPSRAGSASFWSGAEAMVWRSPAKA